MNTAVPSPIVLRGADLSAQESAHPDKRRVADVAYDTIEAMIATLQLRPGSPIVESELIARTGLGRTPTREALMRLVSNGLIVQLPRRGLKVSEIALAEHLVLIETRRVLERLIASSAARHAMPRQRQEVIACAEAMVAAGARDDLDAYMEADQALDHVNHAACRNPYAVAAVVPLTIQCRRFWFAYQHQGDIVEGARCHMLLARAIADGEPQQAAAVADALMDYLELFTRKVIG